MLADSELKGGMLPLTELGQGRQGQPNGGWSEMGKEPLCWDGESKGLPL